MKERKVGEEIMNIFRVIVYYYYFKQLQLKEKVKEIKKGEKTTMQVQKSRGPCLSKILTTTKVVTIGKA